MPNKTNTTKKQSTAKRSSTPRKRAAAAKPAAAKKTASVSSRQGKGGKLSTIVAALTVLNKAGGAMTVAEIAEAATPLTGLTGATPKQTFYSVLYSELKKDKPRVAKSGKGGSFKITAAGKASLAA